MRVAMHANSGFLHAKFAVLMGLVMILFFLLLPGHKNETVRNNVESGFSKVSVAQKALTDTCQKNEKAVVSRNFEAGYTFYESMYLADVRVKADCSAGVLQVQVKMQNTGAAVDPEFVLSGSVADSIENATSGDYQIEWSCVIFEGDPSHVPGNCRRLASTDDRPVLADT